MSVSTRTNIFSIGRILSVISTGTLKHISVRFQDCVVEYFKFLTCVYCKIATRLFQWTRIFHSVIQLLLKNQAQNVICFRKLVWMKLYMMDVSHVPHDLEIAHKRLPLLSKALSRHSKSSEELWIFENLQVMSGVDVSEHDQFYNQLYLPHC